LAILVKQWEDFDRHPLVDQATRLSYLLASFIQPWTSECASLGSRPPNFPYKGCHLTGKVQRFIINVELPVSVTYDGLLQTKSNFHLSMLHGYSQTKRCPTQVKDIQ